VIPRKEADTLHRWSMGAQARIKVMKMKRDLMREIACKFYFIFNQIFTIDLKRPCFKDGKVSENPDPKKTLLTKDEFIDYLKGDSKKYMWDNYLTSIENASGDR